MENQPDPKPVLPDPAILKKLNAIDSNAPKWVFERFGVVSEERRKSETLLTSDAFRAGFMRPFRFMAGLRLEFNWQGNAWEKTGNDLRKAILDYCEAFPDTVKKAGITRKDLQALDVTRDQAIYNKMPRPQELHV